MKTTAATLAMLSLPSVACSFSSAGIVNRDPRDPKVMRISFDLEGNPSPEGAIDGPGFIQAGSRLSVFYRRLGRSYDPADFFKEWLFGDHAYQAKSTPPERIAP
jgi:hypothetical protein